MASGIQAQAMASKQKAVAFTESLELVRCLLRVSVFHISYMRGLFPEKQFKGVDMPNLDGMNIKMLQPACDESKRLIEWVESGVYDAIRHGYLKGLYYGIATDPEGSSLLEEYIFKFSYGEGGGPVHMDFMQRNGRTGVSKNVPLDSKVSGAKTVDAVKYQVVRLMRMLVQICQTLDKVPAERYLFMKLTYHSHTPDDYEPPYFVPVGEEGGVGHFSRKPFSMEVGKVSTHHHSVAMKVKSTLDCCEDEYEDDQQEREGGSEGMASAGEDGNSKLDSDVDMDRLDSPQKHGDDKKIDDTRHSIHSDLAGHPGGGNLLAPEYEAVKSYVENFFETHTQLGVGDVNSVFLDMRPATLKEIFNKLQQEGVARPDDKRSNVFVAGPALLHKLALKKGRADVDALAQQMHQQASMHPDGGAAGTTATTTANNEELGGTQEAAAAAQGKSKVRKASYVADPIHQSKKARKAAETPAAPTPNRRTGRR